MYLAVCCMMQAALKYYHCGGQVPLASLIVSLCEYEYHRSGRQCNNSDQKAIIAELLRRSKRETVASAEVDGIVASARAVVDEVDNCLATLRCQRKGKR